jgi:ribosomal protein S18 acetylase RimI-like enzyme
MPHPLDNPIWHALTGPHANFAIGRGAARRYPREIAPFAAIAEPGAAAYADLAADLPSGAEARLFRPDDEPVPAGWEALGSNPLPQMILESGDQLPKSLPAEARAIPLGLQDAADMLALVEMTKPGPFGPRTVELGGYLGVRDPNGRLIAMAGERMRLPGYVELSAICVHPDARGQGLGAALTLRGARAAFARGEVPFLHVWPDNPARELYVRIGFRPRTTLWLLWRRPIVTPAAGSR